jgi:hypothetical protein
MKIYTPDACTPHRLASMSASYASGSAESVLIDIGLARAMGGVSISDYIRHISRVRSRVAAEEYYIVVPDSYANAEETYRNWLKFAPRLRPYGELVYVAQGFVLPRDWGPAEPALVALPARSQNGRKCSLDPVYCANNIRRFLDAHRGLRIHLLGPAKRELVQLKRWGYLQHVESLDTTAPHMAPTKAAKEMLGGKWQATKEVRCAWFQEWIRGIV